MLLFRFGCLLPLLLLQSLMLFFLLLLKLPGAVQSCCGFTVSPHLLNLSELTYALLVSCVQQLIQTPVKQQ